MINATRLKKIRAKAALLDAEVYQVKSRRWNWRELGDGLVPHSLYTYSTPGAALAALIEFRRRQQARRKG